MRTCGHCPSDVAPQSLAPGRNFTIVNPVRDVLLPASVWLDFFFLIVDNVINGREKKTTPMPEVRRKKIRAVPTSREPMASGSVGVRDGVAVRASRGKL